MIEVFKGLIAQSSYLTTMVYNPQAISNDSCEQLGIEAGVHYEWDALVGCVIFFKNGRYYDLDDVFFPDIPDNWEEGRSYDTLEGLLTYLERLGDK
jgi:hypothetical protein